VKKKMTMTIVGPGKYSRAKKNTGKQTAPTAARAYGLPLPLPAEIYLAESEKVIDAVQNEN
jgi:hypothetical protein